MSPTLPPPPSGSKSVRFTGLRENDVSNSQETSEKPMKAPVCVKNSGEVSIVHTNKIPIAINVVRGTIRQLKIYGYVDPNKEEEEEGNCELEPTPEEIAEKLRKKKLKREKKRRRKAEEMRAKAARELADAQRRGRHAGHGDPANYRVI